MVRSALPDVPYSSLVYLLAHLSDIGVPPRLDASAMLPFAGAMPAGLKSALRFLNLINGDSVPAACFLELVAADAGERRVLIGEIFRASYMCLWDRIDLATASRTQLEEAVAEFGGTPELTERRVAFLLAMARAGGVPLSPSIEKRRRVPRGPASVRPPNVAAG
jgi:hypothetical protein